MKYEYLTYKNSVPMDDEALNKIGRFRWDLVGFTYNKLGYHYIFKREDRYVQVSHVD